MIWKEKENKYHSRKTIVDGVTFDSRKEAKRYAELKLLTRAGEITGLQRQVPFELVPAQRDERGKLLERACFYRADFVYFDKAGKVVVEDTKGVRTEAYKIKRKLMLQVHGIRIREV